MRSWITPEQAAEAIRTGRGRGVRIAVLDSGIESTHPGLQSMRLVEDIAIVEEERKLRVAPGDGCDLYGHGTAVAGIIHEIAPEAEIGSFRVLGESLASRTAIILEGARRAIEGGYHILNCSLGCGKAEHVLKYKEWVDEAYLRNAHVVAACNNQDANRAEWPGFFTSVLAVNMAAVATDHAIYYRPGKLVEFAARGVDVPVLWHGGTTKMMTGSSFAAPRVTAMLACLLSVYPDLMPLQTKALFRRLALPWTTCITAPNEAP